MGKGRAQKKKKMKQIGWLGDHVGSSGRQVLADTLRPVHSCSPSLEGFSPNDRPEIKLCMKGGAGKKKKLRGKIGRAEGNSLWPDGGYPVILLYRGSRQGGEGNVRRGGQASKKNPFWGGRQALKRKKGIRGTGMIVGDLPPPSWCVGEKGKLLDKTEDQG